MTANQWLFVSTVGGPGGLAAIVALAVNLDRGVTFQGVNVWLPFAFLGAQFLCSLIIWLLKRLKKTENQWVPCAVFGACSVHNGPLCRLVRSSWWRLVFLLSLFPTGAAIICCIYRESLGIAASFKWILAFIPAFVSILLAMVTVVTETVRSPPIGKVMWGAP